MADYNSVYTGAEVDNAVRKSAEIVRFEQVYSGSPTDQGVPMSAIPVDPVTGLKSGIYDVVYSPTATDVDSTAGESYISRLYIGDVAGVARGSSVAELNTGAKSMYAINVEYNRDSLGLFKVNYKSYDFINDTGTNVAYFIQKIYRLEEVQ